MFMLTRKQDAKTGKPIVHLDCFLVGLAETFFLADENKSIPTSARDRNGSAEETTSKLRASSDEFNRPNLLPRYFRNTMNLWRRSLCGVTCGHFTSHLLCMFVCSFFFFFFLLCLFSTRSAPTRKLVLSVKTRIVLRRFIYTVSTIFVM